jgi:PPE-repeat protein
MSFQMLPPEINSLLMYSGAGPAPMLEAAAAWNGLASELSSAAESFANVTSTLAGQAWQGAAARAMSAVAAPYAGWLGAAAAQASGAAAQAQAVVSAFESAFAATVHPLQVQANRNGLVQLVMSNLFGQNWPAIAQTEFNYMEMWAQDIAAMVGYHGGASAAAGQLLSGQASLPAIPSLPGLGGTAGGSNAAGAGTGSGGVGGAAAAAGNTPGNASPGAGGGGGNVATGGAGVAAAASMGAANPDGGYVSGADVGDPSAGLGTAVSGNVGNANVPGVNVGGVSPGLMGAGGMGAMMAASAMGSSAASSGTASTVETPPAPKAATTPPPEVEATEAAEVDATTIPAAATPLTTTQDAAGPAAKIAPVERVAAATREPGERLELATPLPESPETSEPEPQVKQIS